MVSGRSKVGMIALVVAVVAVTSAAAFYLAASMTPSAPVLPSNAETFGPSQELPWVSNVLPSAGSSAFSCRTSSECVLVHTTSCFNNMASQQACINWADSIPYEMAYASFLNSSSRICPMFYALANASCACISGGCTLVYVPNSR